MLKNNKIIYIILLIIILVVIGLNFNKITNKLFFYVTKTPKVTIKDSNEYTKFYDYLFVQQEEDYIPENYQDLLNIYYSVLNQGWDEFTFYCPEEYTNCLNDVDKISNNDNLLSNINNYVHPYNSYSTIKTVYDDAGEVNIKVYHLYTAKEIEEIDKAIDEMMEELIIQEASNEEKIKVLHDYIINNTSYDTTKGKKKETQYDSSRIQGVLFDKHAICSGYADTMAVILNKLNIKNYKISSDTHVWNAVYINKAWVHLDLTWDDPVSGSGKETLQHNYFLVTNEQLFKEDQKVREHIFDDMIYQEFKN